MKHACCFVLLVFFCVFIHSEINAQDIVSVTKLKDHEFLLQSLFLTLQEDESDGIKKENNDKIVQKFKKILQDESFFSYPFDSLKQLGKIYSVDSVLRIYSWMLPLKNGFKHFGFVQYRKKKGDIVLFELNDRSEEIQKPETQILNDKNWFGAVYYKILPIFSKKDKTYYLFGFDANNMFSHKKIIEVISINNRNKLSFGKPVFVSKKHFFNRVIFEYSARSVMMLRYDNRYEMIVHDHLTPEKPLYKGQFMFYVPDLSYDGWLLEKGKWTLKEDIDLRNPKK